MADIRPFKAVRPAKDKAAHIAALPYDVMNTAEAREEIKREPLSFLRIDRAETNFDDSVSFDDPKVYEKAASLLSQMIESGDLKADEESFYYIYELTMDKRTQTGIVAAASADDYVSRVIKKHENTRADKEKDRIEHVKKCNAQTGPIFLAYRKNEIISSITSKTKEGEPEYDFVSPDDVRHRVWVIRDRDDIEAVRKAFGSTESIYIADGHHRCASAVKVCLEKRALAGSSYDPEADYNYFLCVLFPDEELKILDYNRLVKDLNGLSEERFFDRLRKKFNIENKGTDIFKPDRKGCIGMYISGTWYALSLKDESDVSDDPVESLDVSILQNEVLSPILNIEDPKTDKRIDFVGGIRGLKELCRRVDSGEAVVAFAMYPTSINELFAVADKNRLMPPKSTWFEPKLRSGLFIHLL
ncbi:MAG: DUF1015 domain-containing protein [Lachnospiraceae bacterium]|nr:DUF1015 domain-containing protein [Lachnospiraceae bacterium]